MFWTLNNISKRNLLIVGRSQSHQKGARNVRNQEKVMAISANQKIPNIFYAANVTKSSLIGEKNTLNSVLLAKE